jgi:hypothetical protein
MTKKNLYIQASELAAHYQDWKSGVGKDNQKLTFEQLCQIENDLDLEAVNLFWSALNEEYEGVDDGLTRDLDVSHLASRLRYEAYA